MLDQYHAIKSQYPDAILFFRMGDFFEMFFEDAKVASRVLEIALTSRNKKDEHSVPMCGVPHRAADNYIARLVEKGYKVAVCDQVEDASLAKGLVKREVIKVITPGMIVDQEFLDASTNNYILSIACLKDTIGLSCLDISTGSFRMTESPVINEIIDEALRINPSEVLAPDHADSHPFLSIIIKALNEKPLTLMDINAFDPKMARELLIAQFKTRSLEGFGCEYHTAGIAAAGAILKYVQQTQKRESAHIHSIETYCLSNFLLIDDVCARNLDLLMNNRLNTKKGSVFFVLDYTKTSMGGRLLARWLRYPLLDIDLINTRLDAIQEAKENPDVRKKIRECLVCIQDMKRLSSKITIGNCSALDFLSLKKSFAQLPEIWTYIASFQSILFTQRPDLGPINALHDTIEQAIREDAPQTIREGHMIKKGYDEALDELIEISQDGKSWIARLEEKERSNTGINSIKIRYNKVFGYYIEIPKSRSKDVPDAYIRKQTLSNAERFFTEELKTLEDKILSAEEKRALLEYDIFCAIRELIVNDHEMIQKVSSYIAQIDVLFALAECAALNGYVRPDIHNGNDLFIEEGRHPVVETMMTDERFVPNTVKMDHAEQQVHIITGPNMAGKSTILRQTAILVLMSQMGSFVPATSAKIPLTDKIFTRVGASDNLAQGQSTFMVEMEETANILHHVTDRSLVIMDEIGRGTSTFDGVSIAWAVAEYLHDWQNKGVKTLFATHYHELTNLAKRKHRIKNFNVAVSESGDQIVFLRQLRQGGVSQSYGIQVARLAGIPDCVIEKAKTILTMIEKGELESSHKKYQPNEVIKRSLSNHMPNSVMEPVQLSLFRNREKELIQRIRTLDLNTMTPIDSLVFLQTLQKQALKC